MKWQQWKKEVLTLEKKCWGKHVHSKDMDWVVWKKLFYDDGYTPKDAVIAEKIEQRRG